MFESYHIRNQLLKLNEGSEINIRGREFVMSVNSHKINLPDNCVIMGDTIYDEDVEIKICRLVRA